MTYVVVQGNDLRVRLLKWLAWFESLRILVPLASTLPLIAIRRATVSLKFLALALILVKITEEIRVEFLAFLLIPPVKVTKEIRVKFLAFFFIPLVAVRDEFRGEFLAFLLIPLVAVHEEIRVKFFALVYIWQQVTFINLSMVMSLEYLLERFATGSCVGYAIARATMDASVLKTRENFMFELRGGTSTSLMHYIGTSTDFIPFCRFAHDSGHLNWLKPDSLRSFVRDCSKWR